MRILFGFEVSSQLFYIHKLSHMNVTSHADIRFKHSRKNWKIKERQNFAAKTRNLIEYNDLTPQKKFQWRLRAIKRTFKITTRESLFPLLNYVELSSLSAIRMSESLIWLFFIAWAD